MTKWRLWAGGALVAGSAAWLGCTPERTVDGGVGREGTIYLTPTSITFPVGATAALMVRTIDSTGYLDTARRYTFVSSDTLVARVSPDGVVSAVRVGRAVVTAMNDRGPSAVSQITVTSP